jgi:hypothetical protein
LSEHIKKQKYSRACLNLSEHIKKQKYRLKMGLKSSDRAKKKKKQQQQKNTDVQY